MCDRILDALRIIENTGNQFTAVALGVEADGVRHEMLEKLIAQIHHAARSDPLDHVNIDICANALEDHHTGNTSNDQQQSGRGNRPFTRRQMLSNLLDQILYELRCHFDLR